MLDSDNKNDAMPVKILDDSCAIHLAESERLMEYKETQNSQLSIEFNDICYSVCHNKKGKMLYRPPFS